MSLAPQHDFRMGTAFSPDRTRRLPGSFPWVLLWLALVAIVAGLIASTNIAGGFADRARNTSATVSAKEPTNHAIVRATYEVDGRTYEVADSFIGPPNPAIRRCPSRNGGDRVLRSQRTRSCRSF